MDDETARKLQSAYELIKAGQREQAREILIPLAQTDPDLSEAWFLLGHAARDGREKIRCFQQVLRINPDHQPAQEQLTRLMARQAAVGSPSETKPVLIPQTVAPKKRNPAWRWGLAALAAAFMCLSGFGLLWGFNHGLFSATASTPESAVLVPVAAPLVASTSTLEASSTPRPTPRPTFTLPPTQTPQPSLTVLPFVTYTLTVDPNITPSPKPKLLDGCRAPNGLSSLTAPFKIENLGKEVASVDLKGLSKNGNKPITCHAEIEAGQSVIMRLMFGDYTYIVYHDSGNDSGSFFINQTNKATMRILVDRIQLGEFP
jgi:hypothetical protein